MRIKYRWEAKDKQNEWITENKSKNKPLPIELFINGDTRKQLLARSRYLLYKSQEKWTESQQQRAKILFENYPDIEKAYRLTNGLRPIYNQFKDVENTRFKSFNTLVRPITHTIMIFSII